MAIAKDASLGKTGASAAATTIVLTTTAAAAVGTAIFVEVAYWDTTNTLTGVTDSASNVYTVDKQIKHAAGTSSAIASCFAPNGLASGGTITATFSASTAERQIGAVSFTGFGGKPLINVSASQTQSTTAAWSAGNMVTTVADALLIGGSRSGGTADGSSLPGTGFTEEFDQNLVGFSDNETMVYQVVSATGTYAVNGTWNVSMAEMATVGVAYNAVPQGGGLGVRPLLMLMNPRTWRFGPLGFPAPNIDIPAPAATFMAPPEIVRLQAVNRSNTQ